MAENDERPNAALERVHDPSRLLALSDGVFAIIITLLVLDIHVPALGSGESLAAAVSQFWPSLRAFVISFIVAGMYWVGHRDLFALVRRTEKMHPEELTVMVLDRERNQDVIAQVRDVGSRVILIPGGDVSAAILAASEHIRDKHVLMGSGGCTEGVLAACAVKCLDGDMQARLLLRTPQEQALAASEGTRSGASLGIEDLCGGNNVFFAATGITTGELLRGVRYDESYAYTQSLVMRSATHTVRFDDAWHDVEKLRS